MRVIDGSANVITYTYDEVGNILAVDRSTVGTLTTPTVSQVIPGGINQDDPASLAIDGTGLLGGVATTSHPGITVNAAHGNDTRLLAEVDVSASAPLGPATFSINTIAGSTTFNLTILAPRPRITDISPNKGPSAGGTVVTVTGLHFTPTTAVSVGSNPASNVNFVDSTTLTAVIPPDLSIVTATTVDVTVTNANGSDTLANGFTYLRSLQCGDLLSGSIDAAGAMEEFAFNGQNGQMVVLTVAETSNWGGNFGDIDARVTLFAPSGTEVITFDSTSQQVLSLTETGTYVIKVNANNLVSTGTYNLGLECLSPLGPIEGTLSCGGLFSGAIDAAGKADMLTFAANAGDTVVLTVAETSNWGGNFGDIDARVTLFAPSGTEVITFDSTSQQVLALTETGTYVIKVNANNLVSTGTYNLGLECLSPLGPIEGTLSCGGLFSGAIDAAGEADMLTFAANAGDTVALTVSETSNWGGNFGDIDARVTLFAPSGAEVITFDSTSQQVLALTETGTYVIKVNANNLVSTGTYNLGLECLSPLGPIDGTLSCGGLFSGAIDAAGEADMLTFAADAGDTVVLTVAETSNWGGNFGDIDARVTLFAPSGAEVVTFDSTAQQVLSLTETGTYVIKVNANNLVSTGTYNLGLECLSPLGPVDGTLSCGGLFSGAIDAAGQADMLTFAANAGDTVVLTVSETSNWGGNFGDIDARLTLYNSSLSVLGTFDSTGQQQFTLSETGVFVIQVNANNFVGTGTYDLGMQCP